MIVSKKKSYLAGISGGPDSMALLDMYKDVIKVVCHINYHKRKNSDFDMKIVQQYCQKNNIIFECLHISNDYYEKATEKNFQALARDLRYNFFVRIASKYQIFNLLIAHQFDDFLETAIMQQNKKSMNFYYGIKKINHYKNLIIYRPLINKTKKALEKYCKKNSINYALDWTNETDMYDRNKVRKILASYPLMKKKIIFLKFVIRNFFQHFREKKILTLFNKWKKQNFNLDFFKKNKKNNLNNLIYLFLKEKKIKNINLGKIINVKNFIFSQKNMKFNRLEKNIFLMKKHNSLLITKMDKQWKTI